MVCGGASLAIKGDQRRGAIAGPYVKMTEELKQLKKANGPVSIFSFRRVTAGLNRISVKATTAILLGEDTFHGRS
jgi:hypothetical protein